MTPGVRRVLSAALALGALLGLGLPAHAGRSVLEAVRARGHVVCGVGSGPKGYSAVNAQGIWSGISVDFCRAIAAGVIGSKEDARSIMDEVKTFLAQTLKLEVSAEKSGIRKADEGAMFLGYELKTYGDGRTRRTVIGGRAVTVRIADDRMQLHVPMEKLARFAERNRLGNLYADRGEAPRSVADEDYEVFLALFNQTILSMNRLAGVRERRPAV